MEGKVNKIWQNEKNFVIEVEGNRYSDFGVAPLNLKEGCEVTFDFVQNGNFKNITRGSLLIIKLSDNKEDTPKKSIEEDKRHDIFRGQCLNIAAKAELMKISREDNFPTPEEFWNETYKFAEIGYNKGIKEKFIR